MKVYRALTRPKLKRGAEWKLTAVNGLFTILLVVTALVSHLWWTLGVAALFYWPGQWLLRQAAKHDPQWLAVYTRSLSHPLNSRASRLCLHERREAQTDHTGGLALGDLTMRTDNSLAAIVPYGHFMDGGEVYLRGRGLMTGL